MSLPGIPEIARRDARRLACILREVGGDGAALADGWMACDVPGSWADYAAGVGVDRPLADADIDALIAFYAARGRPPRVQISPFHHPAVEPALRRRGFVEYEGDDILVRPTGGDGGDLPGLECRQVDPSHPEEVSAFVASQMIGFFAPEEGPAGMRPIAARVARAPRCAVSLLVLDGEVVGSGGVEYFEDSAVLVAGCVHPDARRRGVQSAFLRHRVRVAAARARYVLVGSIPGGPTARNALRAGFRVAYRQTGLQLL